MTKYIKEKSRRVREEVRQRLEETKLQQETVKTIWEATDQNEFACSFTRTSTVELWEISVDQGHFSGYPYVHLSREDLIKLRDALNEELDRTDTPQAPLF